ncbi:MAG: porin family protein [Saprospiraceae bacterium]
MNKLIGITLFMLMSTLISAQESMSRIQIGAKAGLSYSNVYDAVGEEFNADARFGFTGGVFLSIPLMRFLGIQPELLITQKGFKGSGHLFGSQYNFERTTTFFEIPLLVALKPSQFVTILVGPQYSYLIKQRDEFTNSLTSFVQEEEFKNDNIRKNILGITGEFDVDIQNFVLSGRLGWDFLDNKGDGTSSTPRYKNVSGQLTLGIKLF